MTTPNEWLDEIEERRKGGRMLLPYLQGERLIRILLNEDIPRLLRIARAADRMMDEEHSRQCVWFHGGKCDCGRVELQAVLRGKDKP